MLSASIVLLQQAGEAAAKHLLDCLGRWHGLDENYPMPGWRRLRRDAAAARVAPQRRRRIEGEPARAHALLQCLDARAWPTLRLRRKPRRLEHVRAQGTHKSLAMGERRARCAAAGRLAGRGRRAGRRHVLRVDPQRVKGDLEAEWLVSVCVVLKLRTR